MSEQPHPAVFLGLDVGESDHHTVTAAGKTVYDKALPNDEARLRAILDDLAAQITATSNRLRGMPPPDPPGPGTGLGAAGHPPGGSRPAQPLPDPGQTGRGHARARLKKHAPRLAEPLTDEIFDALSRQTAVVAGTEAAARSARRIHRHLLDLGHQMHLRTVGRCLARLGISRLRDLTPHGDDLRRPPRRIRAA
ncbi:hypothetical protein [Kocuria marina]|uniref:hypothetical protein n=1 Tax=Kocuria marina TaxID=223184 RepID=UPI0038CDB874